MPEPTQQSRPATPQQAAAALVTTTASWLGFDEDLPLGCECADPALQIERWRQEVFQAPPSAS